MKKRMNVIISIVMCITMLFEMIIGANCASMSFSDIKKESWYYDEVRTVYEAGIMEGKSTHEFAPNANMSRAEFVTVLCRLSGEEYEGKGNNLCFSDTDKGAWYADYVAWGVEADMIKGLPDNKFAPNQDVSRQEMAVFIDRFISYIGLDISDNSKIDTFVDADKIADYAKDAVDTMRKSGIITGDTRGYFNPTNNASRAEVATVAARMLQILPDNIQGGENGEIESDEDLPYLYSIYLPNNYDSNKQYPLLVYMTYDNYDGVNIYFENDESPAHESIVLVPHVPKTTNWPQTDPKNLSDLIDYIAKKYNTDDSRRYITAVGTACWLAWKTVVYQNERIAGTIFVHGPTTALYSDIVDGNQVYVFNPNDINEGIKNVPIYIVHDRNDYDEDKNMFVIDPNYGKELYEALVNYGHENVHLKETTEFGGTITNNFVSKDDISLLEWLFNQRRETK